MSKHFGNMANLTYKTSNIEAPTPKSSISLAESSLPLPDAKRWYSKCVHLIHSQELTLLTTFTNNK